MLFETFIKLLVAAQTSEGEDNWDVHLEIETDNEGDPKPVVTLYDDQSCSLVSGTFTEVVGYLVDIVADAV